MTTAASARGASARAAQDTALTRALLAGGLLAGPLYLGAGLVEAFTRPGFDITRHSLSLLANGPLGWIHVANLIVSGVLVVGAAVGMWRALAAGPGRRWAPILLAVYGLGLVASGIFKADPARGFPPGTPEDAMIFTTSGLLHLLSGALGFLGLVGACLVMARRFAGEGQRGWQWWSLITGIVFLAGFVGLAATAGSGWALLGFWIGLLLAWAWLTLLAARLRAGLGNA